MISEPKTAHDHSPPIPHHVHLVGIGGAHMSAIAQILLARGHVVSGSDLKASPVTERLAALGIQIFIGHRSDHVGQAQLVVATAAAKSDNPELQEATRRGLPIWSRAAMVARLMSGCRSIAVAGTHGKTTTSGLIAYLLTRAGRNPAYLIGGDVPDLGGNASPGGGGDIVVEADEYAGAFLEYEPHLAVITNVEAEHLDYYGTESALLAAFAGFMSRVRAEGRLIACVDSPLLRDLIERTRAGRLELRTQQLESYGLTQQANWTPTAIERNSIGGHDFTVAKDGVPYGTFQLRLPGLHNVANALAAIAVADALSLPRTVVRETLAEFRGARRRFERVGEAAGVQVIDDFAHHPTEIKATLAAARCHFPGRRLVVAFQPHTYSRTQYLLEQFRTAFGEADALVIVETYAARETPEQGMSAEALSDAIRQPQAVYMPSFSQAADYLSGLLRPGDILLTIGAGDVGAIGPLVLSRLRQKAADHDNSGVDR